MSRVLTIEYSVDEDFPSHVDESILEIINTLLPYMADNISIHLDVE